MFPTDRNNNSIIISSITNIKEYRLAHLFQNSNGKRDLVAGGDEDGLHDVYDEGLGVKFRETAWKKPSQGGRGHASSSSM